MANAIQHANAGDPAKEVHIEIVIADQRLVIRVFDFGQGFDVKQFVEPRHPLEEHGRGIYLMHTIMDEVIYRPTDSGHVLELVKKL
jgi:serine/threonine-protein kinase RsbW